MNPSFDYGGPMGHVFVVTVDPRSTTAPFEQVRSQLAAQIGDGTLVAGTRLPPVRRLAEDLGLAVNTVARAYRELETAGLVETHGRGGTVVTAGGDQAAARVFAAAQTYARVAHDNGIDAERAVQLVRAALDRS
jgi:DNA-binding transcriptional regulator YhcF (GntR family)